MKKLGYCIIEVQNLFLNNLLAFLFIFTCLICLLVSSFIPKILIFNRNFIIEFKFFAAPFQPLGIGAMTVDQSNLSQSRK